MDEEIWYCIQAGHEFKVDCPLEYCVGVEECPLLNQLEEDTDE